MLLKHYNISLGCLFCNHKESIGYDNEYVKNIYCHKCGVEIGVVKGALYCLDFTNLGICFYSSLLTIDNQRIKFKIFSSIDTVEKIFDPNYFNLDLVYRAYKNKDLF